MELETFLATQPWLALVDMAPDTCDAMERLEQTAMHGMLLVNDHSFCSFAPTHGDQTQFDCSFFLQHNRSLPASTKRDASGGAVAKPASSSLYIRILDKMYWIDHAHIERPPKVEASQPAIPVHTVFELGSIRFRVWMDQSLSRDDQLSRLQQVLSSLRQHLRLPSLPPSLQTLHSRVAPIESPYQVFQRHWVHDSDYDDKLSAFTELCESHGVDAHPVPPHIPSPAAIAAMWQNKLFQGDLDTLTSAFGLGFSHPCDAHDDCFLLGGAAGTTASTQSSQSTHCTTSLWELWERYLDANDLPSSEEGQAGSAIEPRVHLLTSAMVCSHLRNAWSRHATTVRSVLEACQSELLDELFPTTLHPPRTDTDIQAACARLNSVKQAKKKALRDELTVLLLPSARWSPQPR